MDDTLPDNYGKKKCPAKRKIKIYGSNQVECISPYICEHKYMTLLGWMCWQLQHENKLKRIAKKGADSNE